MTPLTFTHETLAFFAKCKSKGMTKREACTELGNPNSTVNRRAKKAGLYDELQKIYPPSFSMPFPDKSTWKPKKQILHFRAATMQWRKAS
ncbi:MULTISPECIES: hypothetical protein [Marinobacter]|uniref:hypothetical protein n=1 Tax=Marinobacter TaxID=2742 RepID=UPI00257CC009|nr:hypothetical protein [Marinobacter sp. UBA2688]|tara:strand:+ start:3659 stop:3928 length:270 start_codon:yes stop_codon:yes gene_type:complete